MSDWTRGEITEVTAAVRAAPSVHNTQPWVLEFHHGDTHGASLFERIDATLPRHDPYGRDRRISCGAAVSNLLLAMRILGWQPELTLLPSTRRRDTIATVTARERRQPSDVELARYTAIHHRHSYRHPFSGDLVDAAQRDRLVTAAHTDGVQLRPIHGDAEITVLAKLINRAGLLLRADRAYQRELSAWLAPDPEPSRLAAVTRRTGTLPWAGLVRRTTAIPDVPTLADRLRRECLLLIETPDDGPLDQVRAGMAAQETWLAAVSDGLAGSLLTQPLHLPEIRAGLIEALSLPAFPHALLRLGHPIAP